MTGVYFWFICYVTVIVKLFTYTFVCLFPLSNLHSSRSNIMANSGYEADDEGGWALTPLDSQNDEDGVWWRPRRRFIPPCQARRHLRVREREGMREEARRRRQEEELATDSQDAADEEGEVDPFWCCERCFAKSWRCLQEMLEDHGYVDDAVYAPFTDWMV